MAGSPFGQGCEFIHKASWRNPVLCRVQPHTSSEGHGYLEPAHLGAPSGHFRETRDLIAIPALDLSERGFVTGAGPAEPSTRSHAEAVAAAREFARHGFTRVHIVDLDAARGRGSNDGLAREIIRTVGLDSQVGGGLRDADGVQDTLEAGARWAVVAARALQHLDLIADLASAFPGEIILSVAAKGRRVELDRWPRSLPSDVIDLVEELRGLPLSSILLRATEREGRLGGPDLRLVEDAVEESETPILVSGGVGTIAHLRSLEERGAAGAVVGTALHVGSLNAGAVAAEFAA